MSTSLHAIKAYQSLIPKLRGGAFDDNRIDTVSTSRRTLSSKRSTRFNSNKTSMTSRDLLTDSNPLRSLRTHSSFATAAQGYSQSTLKTEIDEEYHQKYQQNQNELELLKYDFGMLDEKNHAMGNRVQDLEEENKTLTAKYYKLKSNYLLVKDHYNANKLVIKNLEKEMSNYLQKTKDLKTELDKAINEKIHFENKNFELRSKVQALSQCQYDENTYYQNLEQDYKIQIQKLEKDNIQKFQQIQGYQEKFAAGLEDLVLKRDEVFLEKTTFIKQIRELQDKLTSSLEENLQFKNQILQQKQTIHDLENDNDVLTSKLTVLTENYESYIHREPSRHEIRTSVMYQDWNTQKSIETEEITRKYQKQQEIDQQQIENLEQDVVELRNDKECLTRAIDSIQEELLDSRTLFNKEKKQYEQEIEFLKQVISKNEKSSQDEINDLTNKIQSMNQEKSQLESESNKVRFDFNYLESRMTQLQDTIYKLESRNEKLENELATAKDQNKDLITQNLKSQYETLLQDRNQEIIHFKLKDKENSLKIKELENLIEESQLQRENEVRNQLSYSHSYSDISEAEIKPIHQETRSSPLKNRYYENYQIASARVYSSRDEDTSRPVLSSLNSDIQKITSRYNDIKHKYDNVKNQSHHH